MEAFNDWARALESHGLIPNIAELNIMERATVRLTAENIRKQRNRESIAIEAVSEHINSLEHNPQVAAPASDIEREWLDRFWRLAQDITDRQMQTVWARILARKAQTPARYSPRCLEALSLLSREEALELERLSRFVISATARGARAHFFLSSLYRMTVNKQEEEHSKRMRERIGQTYRGVFGPAGLYADSGSGWAQTVEVDVSEGKADLSIGNKSFVIRYPNSPNCLDHIGSGLGITPLGAEIFSLIETEPDRIYVEALSSGLLFYGLHLERV